VHSLQTHFRSNLQIHFSRRVILCTHFGHPCVALLSNTSLNAFLTDTLADAIFTCIFYRHIFLRIPDSQVSLVAFLSTIHATRCNPFSHIFSCIPFKHICRCNPEKHIFRSTSRLKSEVVGLRVPSNKPLIALQTQRRRSSSYRHIFICITYRHVFSCIPFNRICRCIIYRLICCCIPCSHTSTSVSHRHVCSLETRLWLHFI
jgi:hypothetical protein